MELLSYRYFTPRGVTGDELQEIHSIPTAGMSWIYVVLVGLLLCINVIPSVCVLSVKLAVISMRLLSSCVL